MKKYAVLLFALLLCVAWGFANGTAPDAEQTPVENACTHAEYIRAGESWTRCEYLNEAAHVRRTYYQANCLACDMDSTLVIESQEVEPHQWEMVTDACKFGLDGSHQYRMVCDCKTVAFQIRCTGIHADGTQMNEVVLVVE